MSIKEETSLYEIVELDSGEVALRRAGDSETPPLVTIKFSEESQYYLDQARFDIAKIMIEAGLDAVAELNEDDADDSEALEDLAAESNLLH